MEVLGTSHPVVRRLRRLARSASERRTEGVFIAEGPDLVVAALGANWPLEGIYVAQSALGHPRVAPVIENAPVTVVTDAAFERMADAQSPQGVLAACGLPTISLDDVDSCGLTLALENVTDPGNVGTLVRSADAWDARAVLLVGEGVDGYHPKVVRSSAGSIFRRPLLDSSLEAVETWCRFRSVTPWATTLRGGRDPRHAPLDGAVLVWIGSEARGLSESVLHSVTDCLSVPMASGVESLNAAIAGAVVMCEAFYQRSHSSHGAPPPSL